MKKNLLVTFMSVLLAAFLAAGCGEQAKPTANSQAEQPIELNVSAAVSMKDALAEIQSHYQEKHPTVKIVYNLGASGSLQQQIEQGAPADLFISAAPKQMDDLQTKNLIKQDSRKNLLENKLVMIVPQDSTLNLIRYDELTKDSVQKIAIGEPKVVPAGQYAQEVLKKIGIWDQVVAKLVMAKDVRTVLVYVESGNVDAGIVYQTDAASSKKVKIVATAPEGSHKPIVYPAAVLTGAKQPKAAQEFLEYLFSPESQAVFEKYGFTMSK